MGHVNKFRAARDSGAYMVLDLGAPGPDGTFTQDVPGVPGSGTSVVAEHTFGSGQASQRKAHDATHAEVDMLNRNWRKSVAGEGS